MRLVFAGTPEFACPSLLALHRAGHELVLVITQPDRPAGRGLKLNAPVVKEEALSLDLPVVQPEGMEETTLRRRLEEIAPEAVIVVAFGQKIPGWLLSLPRFGCLNVHASLLPRYRGAAPIQRALMNGDEVTGVTIMQLDEGWDTGPLLSQRVVEIRPDDNAGTLHDRLAVVGAELLVETLAALAEGRISPRPQDEAAATRAPKIRPEEMRIDWRWPAARLHNLVRALAPKPLAETFHGAQRLQIVEAALARPEGEDHPPGTVLAVEGEGILVATGRGVLRLVRLKPAGGRVMAAADYARGYRLTPGVVLG
ncbi:MAG: methionyl-tRNA formyltransferase [Firmicutes bacterium]|nr:methionyl-tRNA formyltransferase [Bacillota bacterium]